MLRSLLVFLAAAAAVKSSEARRFLGGSGITQGSGSALEEHRAVLRKMDRAAEWLSVEQALERQLADRSFWAAEWTSVENDLTNLQEAAVRIAQTQPPAAGNTEKVSDLQLGAFGPKSPASAEAKKKSNSSTTTKAVAPSKKVDQKVPAATAAVAQKAESSSDADAAVLKGPKDPVALATELAMLKGIYEQGRERIGDMNRKEKKSKEDFAKKEAAHKENLAEIEARFHSNKGSAEFRAEDHVNATKEENRIFSYWQHCRERQHKQFHNMLKVMHGTMSREKQMIDLYEKALSGKADQVKTVKKQLSQMTGGPSGGEEPEVVFTQTAKGASQQVLNFCKETLVEVRAAREDLVKGRGKTWEPVKLPTSLKL